MQQEFYEKYGIKWHSTERCSMEKMAAKYKVSSLCSIMEGLRPRSILDFGCGLGDALDIFANYFSPVEAIGIDISSTMLKYARKQYPNYSFIQGSVEELKNCKVDLITFLDILEHLEDIPAVLNVAKENSKYIGIKVPLEKTFFMQFLETLNLKEKNKSRLYESEGHLYEFNRLDVQTLVQAGGFDIIKMKTNFVPKDVRFSSFKKNFKKNRSGNLKKIEYLLYLWLSRVPYFITRPFLKIVYGVDLFLVCKS